jgi:hypothetical protein
MKARASVALGAVSCLSQSLCQSRIMCNASEDLLDLPPRCPGQGRISFTQRRSSSSQIDPQSPHVHLFVSYLARNANLVIPFTSGQVRICSAYKVRVVRVASSRKQIRDASTQVAASSYTSWHCLSSPLSTMASNLPTHHTALQLESIEAGLQIKKLPIPQRDLSNAIIRVEAARVLSYHCDAYNGARH